MSKLTVTVVAAAPASEARESFRLWCEQHPSLLQTLDEQSIIAWHIRGPGPDGAIVAKSRYDVVLDDSLAAMLVAPSDLLLDIVVGDSNAFADAEREFEEWWTLRPALQRLLGPDGYIADQVAEIAGPRRRYRVQLQQRDAAALATG